MFKESSVQTQLSTASRSKHGCILRKTIIPLQGLIIIMVTIRVQRYRMTMENENKHNVLYSSRVSVNILYPDMVYIYLFIYMHTYI